MNFDNVTEAADKIMTRPGTIDIFKISAVEFSESDKGNRYMKITFENRDSSFSHNFFLTEKAVPRIQVLAKAITGSLLRGEVLDPQLEAMFKGKTVALKVSGRVNTESGKGYPDLSFGGFAKGADKVGELAFNDAEKTNIKFALEAIEQGNINNADTESADGSPVTGTAHPTGQLSEF